MLHWKQLVTLPEAELARIDIALVNLACAADLPGAELIDHARCVRTLDYWAACVREYTEHYLPKFLAAPGEYENSEAYYRTLCLITVLQRDLGVRYNPAKVPEGVTFETADTFIHGVTQGAGGTCATMPVVYAAVGRRLGYPIRLVSARSHLFARWDDPHGGRLNIEATGRGLSCPPDDHYRTGRYAMPPRHEAACGFLASLAPRAELAWFLGQRGLRCAELGRYKEAADSFAWSSVLDPGNELPRLCLKETLGRWADRLDALRPPGFPRFGVRFPPRRYPAAVPEFVERYMILYEQLEACLADPEAERRWWGPLRQLRGMPAAGIPTLIEVRLDR